LDSAGSRFHVGICYRTPSDGIYGTGNHDLLRNVINELGGTKKHFMLMGDFNYRFLQWPPSDSGSAAVEAHCFYQTLEDNFLSQHVDFCTRDDAILDWVITDEPHMVDSMSDLGLFTGSDHKSLYWKLEIRTMVEPVIRRSLDYAKADVDSMIRALKPLDWYNLLDELSVEDSWNLFKDKIETVEQQFIPVKRSTTKTQKPVWMTLAAYKAVRQRRQVYSKYKNTRHPAYLRAAKRAKLLVNEARRLFEEKLAQNIKDDRKSFFAFARSKSKSKVSTGSLYDSNGELVNDSKVKVEMLNDFFCSVFTREDEAAMPLINTLTQDKLMDVDVTVDLVYRKLCSLKTDKSAGDDGMSPFILKALSEVIAVLVAIIFRKSLNTGTVPRDWRTANVSPLFKKGSKHQVNNY